MSGLVEQKGILLGIKALDFVAKDTGELVRGNKIVLCRPSDDTKRQYDGYGYVPFDLCDISLEGLARVPELIKQVSDHWLQEVIINCSVDLTGRFPRYKPVSITPVF